MSKNVDSSAVEMGVVKPPMGCKAATQDEMTLNGKEKRYLGNRLNEQQYLCFVAGVTVLVTCVILAIIIIPIMVFVVGKDQAQSSLDQTSLDFNQMYLNHPTAKSIGARNLVAMGNPGQYGGYMDPFEASVEWKGKKLGNVLMPRTEVTASMATEFYQATSLALADSDVMHELTAALLAGEDQVWTITGKPSLHASLGGLSVSYDLDFNKEIAITAGRIDNIVARDVVVLEGATANTLQVQLTTVFANDGVIGTSDFGDVTFDLLSEDGSVRLGSVLINDFSLAPNQENTVAGVVATMQRSAGNTTADQAINDAVNAVLNNWTLGRPSALRMAGPVTSSTDAAWLLNTIDSSITLEGLPATQNRLVVKAKLDLDELATELAGLLSGGGLGNITSSVWMEAQNPLAVDVHQTDLTFNVALESDMFGFRMGVPAGKADNNYAPYTYANCPPGRALPQLIGGDKSITVEAGKTAEFEFKSLGLTDLCAVGRTLGLVWGLVKNAEGAVINRPAGNSTFTSTQGFMNVNIGAFAVPTNYGQGQIEFGLKAEKPMTKFILTALFALFKLDWWGPVDFYKAGMAPPCSNLHPINHPEMNCLQTVAA